jgi:hypothetical protein
MHRTRPADPKQSLRLWRSAGTVRADQGNDLIGSLCLVEVFQGGLIVNNCSRITQVDDPLNSINSQYCCNQIRIPGAIAVAEVLSWFILVNQSAFAGSSDLQPAAENFMIDPSRCSHLNAKFMRMPTSRRSVEQKECRFAFNCRSAFIAERGSFTRRQLSPLVSNFLRRAPNVGNELVQPQRCPLDMLSPFMNTVHLARSVLFRIGR